MITGNHAGAMPINRRHLSQSCEEDIASCPICVIKNTRTSNEKLLKPATLHFVTSINQEVQRVCHYEP